MTTFKTEDLSKYMRKLQWFWAAFQSYPACGGTEDKIDCYTLILRIRNSMRTGNTSKNHFRKGLKWAGSMKKIYVYKKLFVPLNDIHKYWYT